MKQLTQKFKPANVFSQDFIEADILPKLNYKIPAADNATKEELVQAVSAFFAHGQREYIVDYSENALIEEVLSKLVYFGYLRPDRKSDKVFRLDLPIARLEFRTLSSVAGQPKVVTKYKTTYTDGSHSEVDYSDIAFVDGYTLETWERYYGKFSNETVAA